MVKIHTEMHVGYYVVGPLVFLVYLNSVVLGTLFY
jgi:hypothetical protein